MNPFRARKRKRPVRWPGRPIILAVLGVAASGCQSHRQTAVEKMMWSTYPVATMAGDATGFVVTCEDKEAPEGVTPVLFTSVHVLKTARKNLLAIAFREPGAAGEEPIVSLLAYQPTAREKDSFYVKHPLYDVAALRLRFPADIAQQAKLPSELTQRKLLKDRVEVKPGDEVYFLGYPEVFPGTDGAMPILRSGRVASYVAGKAGNGGRFLINADVYPGDSGGPVFIVRHGRAHLAGVITQRVGPTKESFSHLAVAVNASAIRETLEMLMQSEKR